MLSDVYKLGSQSKGFSLIEIMVALVVLAIVAVLAVPNFRNMVQSNNITASANNLMSSFSLARSEAVKRNMPVTICASSSQVGCTGVDWNNGWIVFTDAPANGLVDGGDEILSAVRGLPAGMELMASEPYIQFKPNGALASCNNCISEWPNTLANVMDSLHNWILKTMYMLIPGEVAWAQSEHSEKNQRNKHQKQHGRQEQEQDQESDSNPPSVEQGARFGVEFIFCDATQTEERGQRIFVSLSGQITQSTITCD